MTFLEQYGLVRYSTHLTYPRTGPCELRVSEDQAARHLANAQQRRGEIHQQIAKLASQRSTPARTGKAASLNRELELIALTPETRGQQLIFDHCHGHGWIRGVVCLNCNGILAQADAGRISSGTGYAYPERLALRRWQERCPDCRAVPERRVRL